MLKVDVWGVVVFSLVVHDDESVYEVEAVAPCFPGRVNHFFLEFLVEFGNRVNAVPRVSAARNAKRKLEVKRLNQLLSEVVALYHSKLFHWLLPNRKSERRPNLAQFEEVWPEVVAHCSELFLVQAFHILQLLVINGLLVRVPLYLEKALIRVVVPDLKLNKLNIVSIRPQRTNKVFRWLFVRQHIRNRYLFPLIVHKSFLALHFFFNQAFLIIFFYL